MVGILEDQGRLNIAVHSSRLWLDQPPNHSKQGAFPAPVAAYKHPQTWPWNAEAAAIKSAGSAGPAKTHAFKLKNSFVGVCSHRD